MSIKVNLRITDIKTGKVEYDKPSHSFTLQFSQLLCLLWKNASYTGNIKDISNTNRTGALIDTTNCIRSNAPVGDNTFGIVVGTDNTAESISDYKLNAICSHGVGADDIMYGQSGSRVVVNLSGTMSFILLRIIANGSGANVTIEEVGLYMKQKTYYFCGIRDITGGLVIADGASKLVEYIFTVAN